MKKLTFCITAAVLSLTFNPIALKAENATTTNSIVTIPTSESTEVKALSDRVYEIKAMDKSKLSSFDKKELREELRTIKKELRERGRNGGIYISAGGLIIIILLIIIFL